MSKDIFLFYIPPRKLACEGRYIKQKVLRSSSCEGFRKGPRGERRGKALSAAAAGGGVANPLSTTKTKQEDVERHLLVLYAYHI